MLNPQIREFLEMLLKMNEVGCLTVPEVSLKMLRDTFHRASVIVGNTPQKGRVTYHEITSLSDLEKVAAPAVCIITEELYTHNPVLQETLRDKAAYFINVK